MKTKNIPAIIMLTAGFIDCVFSIINRLDMMSFTKRLLFVLVIFYILGIGVKIVLDKAFPVMSEEEPTEETTEEESVEDLENIDTEEETESEFDDL